MYIYDGDLLFSCFSIIAYDDDKKRIALAKGTQYAIWHVKPSQKD